MMKLSNLWENLSHYELDMQLSGSSNSISPENLAKRLMPWFIEFEGRMGED